MLHNPKQLIEMLRFHIMNSSQHTRKANRHIRLKGKKMDQHARILSTHKVSRLSSMCDGELIAQYINSEVDSENYLLAKTELEKRRYKLERQILDFRK
jgi:hypothetical protein